MGKVFKNNRVGFVGEVSRSSDNVIISVPNASGEAIAFGWPVFMKSDGTGAIPIASTMTSDDVGSFLGITVRSGAKTPDTYGSADSSYAANEPMDVLVRGNIVMYSSSGTAQVTIRPGAKAYLDMTYGCVCPVGTDRMDVPGIFYNSARDAAGNAEVVITERHTL